MTLLVVPSTQYEIKFRDMMRDYQAHEESYFDSDYFEKDFDFKQYLIDMKNLEQGIDLPPGNVPCNEWWLVNENNDIIGTVRLRHYLSDYNREEGGHIGYDIAPRFRKKGFGNEILQRALQKAKEFGLERVLLTCDFDNIASAKIIEKNGGIFERETISEDSNKRVFRYWIDIQ